MMTGGAEPPQLIEHLGVRHTGDQVGFYSLPRAVARAQRLASRTGVRHRVETCKAAADEHAHPCMWAGTHYVVAPVTVPGFWSAGAQ